jgi:lysophospholipase L1-like esterase
MKKIGAVLLALIPLGLFAQSAKWDTIPVLPEHYQARVALFKAEPVVKGKILFLGNSLTEGGNWKKLLKDSAVLNRGIGGDITFGVLLRLDDVIKRQPSKVFILIGINDLAKNIPDEVIQENIFSIVKKIKRGSPQTQIFLQSILPTNSSFKTFPVNYRNKDEHVITINEQLMKYGDRLGYTYVDLYSGFVNSHGVLEPTLSSDGLHLNPAGYLTWIKILQASKCL